VEYRPLSDKEINEIESRVSAATAADWHAVTRDGLNRIFAYDRFIDVAGIVSEEDAVFIAHARLDIPRLVAEIARLRARLGEDQ
jgi:hypothetical protein